MQLTASLRSLRLFVPSVGGDIYDTESVHRVHVRPPRTVVAGGVSAKRGDNRAAGGVGAKRGDNRAAGGVGAKRGGDGAIRSMKVSRTVSARPVVTGGAR